MSGGIQFAESGSGGGKPSVAELTAFASKANEISMGDDLVDLGDNLGLDLIANPNKVAPSPRGAPGGSSRQVSFGGGGGGVSEIPSLSIKPVDDLDVVNLEAAPGASDIKISRDMPSEPAPFVINTGNGGAAMVGAGFESGGGGMSAEDENRQKQEFLTKIRRLEVRDIKSSLRLTMSNSLEEIKSEYEKLTDSRNLEASIRFQRNALMTFVTGVEMVNDKVGHRLPVKPRLKGWSESVHTNIEDFDDIFEELYDLYKDKAKVHPIVRLVGTLGVSATMYHLTNSAAERSGIPGMGDVLNENPELRAQFAAAMAAKMGGGLGNFMSAASGGGGPIGMPPMPTGPAPAPMGFGTARPPPPSPPRAAMDTRVPFNQASGASARREMRGPSGVDDILKAFEAERQIGGSVNVAPGDAGIFTPSGPPPTPPTGVSILREGGAFGDFGLEETGSVGSGSTMNTERRRGRRRAAATPVGATLNLNV
jgi:hypothetical protein